MNQFLLRHFHAFFWPALTGALLLGFIQQQHQRYLQNNSSPHGISDLATGRNRAIDSAIVASWKKDTIDLYSLDECRDAPATIDRLKLARDDIRISGSGFIICYTLLAILLIATLQARQEKQKDRLGGILIALTILAGLCNAIGNLGMLRFIDAGLHPAGIAPPEDVTATITRTMTLVRYGILGMIALVYLPLTLIFRDNALQTASGYLRAKAFQLFRYRVILVSLLFFTLPIWMMDQGQDLLVNSNASDTGVLLFLTVICIAAALNWWLSKLFFERDYRSPLYPLTEPMISDRGLLAAEKKVSRFLGIATMLIPGTAILQALQALQIHFPLDIFPPLLWLIALLSVFYALIRHDVAGRLYFRLESRFGRPLAPRLIKGLIITLAFLLPALLRFVILGSQRQAPSSLFWLFFHLLLLAIASWIFFSTRNNIFHSEGWLGKKIGWPITIAGVFLVGAFLYLNFCPLSMLALDCNYLSLPLLLAGIVCYILVFTLLIRISLRTKINFTFFILSLVLVISATATSDYHEVTPLPATDTIHRAQSPVDLENYFRGWVLARAREIDSVSGTYPVFLVNTYGGGIKASAFTNMVLTYLDQALIRDSKSHQAFHHYIFSVSGASGGTIGAAVQCAFWARHPVPADEAAYNLDGFSRFYTHDFLSPLLAAMLGRDVLASIAPGCSWDDRSAIQEKTWTGFAKTDLGLDLTRDFCSIWDTAGVNPARYQVPLLFSNTLNVDDGLKGIMAPVKLPEKDFPGTIFIQDRIDALHEHISLATGAFLSARFPFISPSGKMGAGYHFMDGGGKDNSGASTSEAIFLSLAHTALAPGINGDSSFSRLAKKLRFYFISITNNPYYNPDTRKLVANRFELISPIVGIVNSGIYGNAQAADETLQYRYPADHALFQGLCPDYSTVWITGSCISDGDKGSFKPVLPLGWQISRPSLDRLRQSFDSEKLNSYNPVGIRKIAKIMNGF